jgi:phytoene synthase
MSTTIEHAELRLSTAYSVCRQIARRSAKNFYYGFMLLPSGKRNALSAVYAFMRHADDLADDPGMTPQERRQKLEGFLEGMHRALSSPGIDDPVFLALADAQQRYKIPVELLDRLVAGTAMDVVEDAPADGPQVVYQSFDELYRYCYHVASVVGLVCIHIFGYRDPAAERLAEHMGIAFQLTNILRDVKEDAAMGRIYLPQEDLQRFGVSREELAAGAPMEKLRPLLQFEAARAREFYNSAEALLPLVDEVSQPALWAMREIYRGILDKIELLNYDVYTERVRLSTGAKLKVLARGFGKRLL